MERRGGKGGEGEGGGGGESPTCTHAVALAHAIALLLLQQGVGPGLILLEVVRGISVHLDAVRGRGDGGVPGEVVAVLYLEGSAGLDLRIRLYVEGEDAVPVALHVRAGMTLEVLVVLMVVLMMVLVVLLLLMCEALCQLAVLCRDIARGRQRLRAQGFGQVGELPGALRRAGGGVRRIEVEVDVDVAEVEEVGKVLLSDGSHGIKLF